MYKHRSFYSAINTSLESPWLVVNTTFKGPHQESLSESVLKCDRLLDTGSWYYYQNCHHNWMNHFINACDKCFKIFFRIQHLSLHDLLWMSSKKPTIVKKVPKKLYTLFECDRLPRYLFLILLVTNTVSM